jgi:hypothetical protein
MLDGRRWQPYVPSRLDRGAAMVRASPVLHPAGATARACPALHRGAAMVRASPALHPAGATARACPALHRGAAMVHASPALHPAGATARACLGGRQTGNQPRCSPLPPKLLVPQVQLPTTNWMSWAPCRSPCVSLNRTPRPAQGRGFLLLENDRSFLLTLPSTKRRKPLKPSRKSAYGRVAQHRRTQETAEARRRKASRSAS